MKSKIYALNLNNAFLIFCLVNTEEEGRGKKELIHIFAHAFVWQTGMFIVEVA